MSCISLSQSNQMKNGSNRFWMLSKLRKSAKMSSLVGSPFDILAGFCQLPDSVCWEPVRTCRGEKALFCHVRPSGQFRQSSVPSLMSDLYRAEKARRWIAIKAAENYKMGAKITATVA